MDMAEVPDNVDLMTLRLQKQDLEHRASNEIYRTKVARMFRKTNYISKVDFVSGKTKSPSEQRASLAEVVMAVQIYKPIKMPAGPRKVRMGGCLSYKDLYKSGFFFIGNTFYNDMSSSSCKDYSQVIRDWAQNSRREVGPFEARRMDTTRFVDLELRLGYPYVYLHQGHCEHLLVFSDLRMLHPDDSQNPHDYPLRLKSFPFGKRVLCMLCHTTIAKWVTYGNERVTDDPFFFCDVCFHSYNYTADNKKIGHFRAEPFLDWNAVL